MDVTIVEPEAVDVDALASIYAAAFSAPPYEEPDASGLLRRLPEHRGHQGFTLALAREGGRGIGFAYGFTGRRGQVWTDEVAEALGPDRATELLDGHFELVELAVHPDAQGRGAGRALLSALLAGRPEPHVLLQTHDSDTSAMRLYLRAGFTREVAVPFGVVLSRPLP